MRIFLQTFSVLLFLAAMTNVPQAMAAETQTQPPESTLSAPNDVVYTAAIDGSQEHYIEMLPAGFDAAQSHDVLIALHGHGSDRSQYATEPRGECKGARDVA